MLSSMYITHLDQWLSGVFISIITSKRLINYHLIAATRTVSCRKSICVILIANNGSNYDNEYNWMVQKIKQWNSEHGMPLKSTVLGPKNINEVDIVNEEPGMYEIEY